MEDLMILIITNKADAHADFVIARLLQRRVPFLRLNTEDLPTKIKSTVTLDSRTGFSATMQLPPGLLSIKDVKTVWLRRPLPPLLDRGISEPAYIEHTQREITAFLDGIWNSMDCTWINHPLANKAAGEKITQLKVAQALGFTIPKTVITNDPQVAREFILSTPCVITKPLKRNRVPIGEGLPKAIYTSIVTKEHLEHIASVRLCPTLFQSYIEKKVELRITMIGNQVFAAALDSQSVNGAEIDWRMVATDTLPHRVFQLPEDIKTKCLLLLQHFNLKFGAIDMVITPTDEFVFLEINPNGQWVWIEQLTNMPMVDTMSDLLQNGTN